MRGDATCYGSALPLLPVFPGGTLLRSSRIRGSDRLLERSPSGEAIFAGKCMLYVAQCGIRIDAACCALESRACGGAFVRIARAQRGEPALRFLPEMLETVAR